jgi:hypothetical protein
MIADDLLTIARCSGKHLLGVHPSVMAELAGSTTLRTLPSGYRMAATLADRTGMEHVVLEAWPNLLPCRVVALDDEETARVF